MMTDHSAAAELIAGAVLLAITLIGLVGRKENVATATVTYTDSDKAQHTLQAGAAIPSAAMKGLEPGSYKQVYLRFVRMLVVGKDNRISTSKAVVLAWTYAVVFGLLALIVAKWLGDPRGYQALVKHGLRGEYLLFLGGPYAAAVLAKYKAQISAGKTDADVGSANPKQLVTDDQGDIDLGDFQYVLFNALALAFYLGSFIPHLQQGMPQLPSLLTGLALTSAGGYTAKQLVGQARPTLASLLPTSAAPSSMVEVWGDNLLIPASAAPAGSPLVPAVTVGGVKVDVKASEQTLGADHLTVEIPSSASPGETKLCVVRADGVRALGPGGSDCLPLRIS
jgi:hypothetical protein